MNSNLWDFSGDRYQRGLMKPGFLGEKSYLKLFATSTESFVSILALRGQIFGKWGRKDGSSGFALVQWNIGSCLSNTLNI